MLIVNHECESCGSDFAIQYDETECVVRFCISVRIVQSAVTMRLMKYLYEGVCLRLNTIMIGSHVRFVKLI